MNGSRISAGAAALVVVFTTVFASGAFAAAAPRGMSPQAFQALHERSQALNARYHLGAPVRSAPGTGGSVDAALNALRARGEAMNARYHLGTYAVVKPVSGFDWADAGVGAAGMLGAVLLAGGLVVVGRRRHGGGASTLGTA